MKTLLLLLDSMIYYDRQILKGIKAKLDELNFKVDLHLECSSNLDYLLSRQWDYVIADYDKPNINHIVDSLGAKAVVYSSCQHDSLPTTLSSITIDNQGLANTALKGFEVAGIKSVGYFANQHDSVFPWSKERQYFFQQAASIGDFEFVDDVMQALESRDFPLGVYCSSDRSARRLANLCKSLAIRTPEEVSIIGTDCDDTERMLSPLPLSSIEINPVALGKLCVETLDKRLRFKRVQHVRFTSYQLNHEGTTTYQQQADKVVIEAESFIRNHFHQNMKIKQVTDCCRVSRKTLDSRFLVAHGMTAHQYVTKLRLERAKQLLVSTTEKLDAIAKQCGYPGQSYLTQVFIKQIGVAPAHYRQQKIMEFSQKHT